MGLWSDDLFPAAWEGYPPEQEKLTRMRISGGPDDPVGSDTYVFDVHRGREIILRNGRFAERHVFDRFGEKRFIYGKYIKAPNGFAYPSEIGLWLSTRGGLMSVTTLSDVVIRLGSGRPPSSVSGQTNAGEGPAP